jgi:hypothetical protein
MPDGTVSGINGGPDEDPPDGGEASPEASGGAAAGGQSGKIREELYKSLLAEGQGYLGKMAGLWLQKLVLVGGVMVFLLGHREDPEKWERWMQAPGPVQDVLALATLALPLLALLLDLKHAEYAIQARAISRFVRRAFGDVPVVRDWEESNWGDAGGPSDRLLPWLRSLASASAAALPTLALTYLALAVVGWRFHVPGLMWVVGVLVTLAACVGSWVFWRLLWPDGFTPLWRPGWEQVARVVRDGWGQAAGLVVGLVRRKRPPPAPQGS